MKLILFENSYQIEVLTTDANFSDELIKFKLQELHNYRRSKGYWASVITNKTDTRYVLENNKLKVVNEFKIN